MRMSAFEIVDLDGLAARAADGCVALLRRRKVRCQQQERSGRRSEMQSVYLGRALRGPAVEIVWFDRARLVAVAPSTVKEELL